MHPITLPTYTVPFPPSKDAVPRFDARAGRWGRLVFLVGALVGVGIGCWTKLMFSPREHLWMFALCAVGACLPAWIMGRWVAKAIMEQHWFHGLWKSALTAVASVWGLGVGFSICLGISFAAWHNVLLKIPLFALRVGGCFALPIALACFVALRLLLRRNVRPVA